MEWRRKAPAAQPKHGDSASRQPAAAVSTAAPAPAPSTAAAQPGTPIYATTSLLEGGDHRFDQGDSESAPVTPSLAPAEPAQATSPGAGVTSPSYPAQPVLLPMQATQLLQGLPAVSLPPGAPVYAAATSQPFLFALPQPVPLTLQPGSPCVPQMVQALMPVTAASPERARPVPLVSPVQTSSPRGESAPAFSTANGAVPTRGSYCGMWVRFRTMFSSERWLLGRIDASEPADSESVPIAALGGWFTRRPPAQVRKAYLIILDLPTVLFWRARQRPDDHFFDSFFSFLQANFAVGVWSGHGPGMVEPNLRKALSSEQYTALTFVRHSENSPCGIFDLWSLDERPEHGRPPACRLATHGWRDNNTLLVDGGEGTGRVAGSCFARRGTVVYAHYPAKGHSDSAPLRALQGHLEHLLTTEMDIPSFVQTLPPEWHRPADIRHDPDLLQLSQSADPGVPAARRPHRVARLGVPEDDAALAVPGLKAAREGTSPPRPARHASPPPPRGSPPRGAAAEEPPRQGPPGQPPEQ